MEAREVAAARDRVLGADHPDTLVSRREVAVALGWLGRWGEALGPTARSPTPGNGSWAPRIPTRSPAAGTRPSAWTSWAGPTRRRPSTAGSRRCARSVPGPAVADFTGPAGQRAVTR